MLLFGNLAFATTFNLDKSSYEKGDTIVFSGTLETGKFYTYQVFNPPADNFAHFNMIQPNPDGTFSDSFKADGTYWNLEGTYCPNPLDKREPLMATKKAMKKRSNPKIPPSDPCFDWG